MDYKEIKVTETENFIDEFQKEEALWDVVSPKYKDKNEKTVAIERLSERFDLTKKEVKTKIQSLRTYYGKELNKEKDTRKSGVSASDVYESKWPHFKSLDFLRDTITPRKSHSNLIDNDDLDANDYDAVDTEQSYLQECESDVEGRSEVLSRSTSKPITKKRKAEPEKKDKADELLDKAMKVFDNRKPPATDDE